MPVLKPVRGIRLNKSHPLARGLVGYWLLNEGSGNKVFDLSGNGRNGTFNGNTAWSTGQFGPAINNPGAVGDFISIPDIGESVSTLSAFIWVKTSGLDNKYFFGHYQTTTSNRAWGILVANDVWAGATGDELGVILTDDGTLDPGHVKTYWGSVAGDEIADGKWHLVGFTWNAGTLKLFIDGREVTPTKQSDDAFTTIHNSSASLSIGDINPDSGGAAPLNGILDIPMIWNRALSSSEIALLYRGPFCMFDRAWRPLRLGGQIVELAGTSTVTSSVEGSLSVSEPIVELVGTIAGRSNVNGHLSLLDWTKASWLTEALFNGMTANAFKLGTSLSLGWFWVRVTGCSVLYRGECGGMDEIDFGNILAVSNLDDYGGGDISPPSYIPHDGSPNGASTYFYVVRRFNNCGYQELTLTAAVKVSIKPNGELAEPQPNNIASVRVEQVDSNKVRLTWYYCPLEQGSKPICFNVYYDDRTGQIDYENPLFSSEYEGRRFYSFQSSALEADEDRGGYLFAIRAEDADGIENISLARLKIQLDTLNPDAIDILRAEAV